MTSSYRLRVLSTILALFAASILAPAGLTAAQPADSPRLVADVPNATPFDPRSIDVVTGAATQDFSTLGNFTLPSGASITLEFDVTVNSVIPSGTSMVANQAGVGADQLAMSVASDDPTTGMSPDPTVTLLFEEAEMGITKTDVPASATSIPGNSITYNVVVTNAGPFGALDAEVTDFFPAELANCTWACAGTGNCDTTNGVGDVTAVTVDLEVGESVTFSATCDIDPTATGSLVNTATVDPPDGFSDPGVNPNMATDTNTLVPTGDLSIDKTTDTSPVVPGGAIQYTIVVANTGPSTATGVDVSDNFPAAVTGATWTCAPAGGAVCPNAAGAGDVAETVTLPAGGMLTYTVSGTVDAGAVGSIMNTASLTVPAGFTDGDGPANNSDTVTDNLDAMIDVDVNKTTLTAVPLVPGAQVQYQVVVANGGPSDATGVSVSDNFAGTLSNVTWTCAASAGSSCAASGNGNIAESVDVVAGGMVTFTVTADVSPTATGMLVNTANIVPPAGDASNGDDSSTVMDALEPQGDLSIDKQTLTSPVTAGQPVTYQVVVANSGPSTATNAQVQDNLPASLANTSWTCVASAGSSCTAGPVAGDVLDMVTLAAGGSVTYTITGDLAADATGVLSNTATVSIPGGFTDTNMGNESDTVMNAISVVADLMVLKQDDGAVEPGDPITYTIVVTNLGPSDVTGATVTDTVPAELSNVTWTCVADPGASCTAMGNGDVNDSVDLPAGASVTYTLVGDTPGMPTTIENTASVAAPVGVTDPTADNDSDSVTTSVAQVLAIPTLSTYGFALLALLLAGLGLWQLRRRGGLVAGLMLLLLFGFAGAADAQTTVDDFATAQGPHANPDASTGSTVDGAVILGGERDLELTFISGMTAVTGEVTGGAFEFDAPAGTRGEATLTWDGNDDDEDTLDPVGLGGVNLTTTGQSGFRLTVDAADVGTELIVRVFTDGSNHSQAARLVPTAIVGTTDVFIPFSEFRSVAGSGADFTNVGAVVLVVRGEDVAATIDNFDTAGPLLVVEKVDLDPMTNTEIGASEVAAGSTIRYRVTVTNSGGEATTVDVTDMVDGNTTLVANTLNTTPIAVPDSYRWYGNVTLTVPDGANDLLANDADPDGDTFTITANDATSEQGGTVSGVNASTGAFTYDPPAGFTGVDSFTYTIEDDDGNASTATATIALLSTIWFVDSDACALAMLPCGTGTQADPFGELEQAEAASGPNDVIRLRQGGADLAHHNQGILLKAGQQLIGQGVDLVVDGVHIEGDGTDDGNLDPNPANRPSITHAAGNGLTLHDGVTVLGLNVVGTSGSGVFGSNVDAPATDHVAVVDSGGPALEVTNSTNLALTFTGLDSLNSANHGVLLDAVTGNVTVNGPTQLDDPAGAGVRIVNSPGFTAGFNAVNVVDAGGGMPHAAVHLASNAGGTFTFGVLTLDSENGDGFFALNGGTVNHPSSGNTVNAVGGAAVDVQSTTGNAGGSPGWSFDSLASAGSPDQGVRLVSLGQDFTVGAGGTTITDPDAVGILVETSAGRSFDFDDASVTDTNVGAGATANGVDLATGNAGATFTFDSLAVTTDGGFGLLANNSGTINVAGTDGNSIVANGGAALDVTSTGAGSGWTFDTLSSAGSTGTGVNLVTFSGTVTGESGSITGSAGTAFNVDGGAPSSTYSGSVTQNAAQRVVNVEDTTGGSVDFNTGTVTGGAASLGVRIDNADGNASFADLNLGTSGSPMTNQALTLTGGSTGTFGFAGTQIFTTGAMGVEANNGGVVEFTGAGNRVTATNAVALRFLGGTTIGANHATLERIDASGAANGIFLANTGANGSLIVTGSGAADSGGVIQSTTGDGIHLDDTMGPSFTRMRIQNTGRHGLHVGADSSGADQVNGLTLNNTVFSGNGNAVFENAVNFREDTPGDLVGPVNITGSTFTLMQSTAISGENFAGSLTMVVDSSSFTNNLGANGQHGIQLIADGTSAMDLTVQNNTSFSQIESDGIQLTTDQVTNVFNARLSGITFTAMTAADNAIDIGTTNGTVNATIDTVSTTTVGNTAILFPINGTTNADITISNVIISGSTNGRGIDFFVDGDLNTAAPSVRASVADSNISGTFAQGIFAQVGDGTNATSIDLTLTDNTIGAPSFVNRSGIHVTTFDDAANPPSACVDATGNTSAGNGAGVGIRLENLDGTLGITQASLAALSAANNGSTTSDSGTTITFNDNCTAPTATPAP